MAKLTIREAVKIYDVSRPTLNKSLKSGKISGVQDGKGHWQIDPAELSRVYHPRQAHIESSGKHFPKNFTAANTPDNSEIERLKSALAAAEARADAAETLAHERAERIEDLRRMLPPPDTARSTGWRWPWQRQKV